jgi:photosynthetic reaction center H subunit
MGLTSHIDLTLVLLYAFWAFFACLVFYLHKEGKREGYPLQSDQPGGVRANAGIPGMAPAKSFSLADGSTVVIRGGNPDTREVKAKPVGRWPGAPLEPTGNPMIDGVGPASYAMRADHPDMTLEGHAKIVPLRVAKEFFLESRDPDPRGMTVMGADNRPAGIVKDAWVDQSEYILRYYEVELADKSRSVLLPVNFATINRGRGEVRVNAIMADQFANVPATKHAEQVTLLEEDKICGYYGGGYLYAHPSRTEALL